MSRPLEGTYGLYVWEVGGSSSEPTDTGRRGEMGTLMEEGQALVDDQNDGGQLELSGRRIELAGFVVRPEPEEAATDGE